MEMKTMWKVLALKLINWALDYIYNDVDLNKDGKLSKQELKDYSKKLEKIVKKIKSKIKK